MAKRLHQRISLLREQSGQSPASGQDGPRVANQNKGFAYLARSRNLIRGPMRLFGLIIIRTDGSYVITICINI